MNMNASNVSIVSADSSALVFEFVPADSFAFTPFVKLFANQTNVILALALFALASVFKLGSLFSLVELFLSGAVFSLVAFFQSVPVFALALSLVARFQSEALFVPAAFIFTLLLLIIHS